MVKRVSWGWYDLPWLGKSFDLNIIFFGDVDGFQAQMCQVGAVNGCVRKVLLKELSRHRYDRGGDE